MNIFKEIREFFWPLLEKGEDNLPINLEFSEITVDSSHLEKTLEYAIDCYNAESDRKKSIESKSDIPTLTETD